MLRQNIKLLLRSVPVTRVAFRTPIPAKSLRPFSTSAEPSLEAMESFLLKGESKTSLHLSEIVSNEIVRFPTVQGVAVGKIVRFDSGSSSVEGVVVHFDKNFSTAAVRNGCAASLSRASSVSLTEKRVKLSVPRVKFALDSARHSQDPLPTHVPVIDMLLPDFVTKGMTVGIYSSSASVSAYPVTDNVVLFPSKPNQSSLDMYLDLIAQASEVLSRKSDVTLVADLRHFEAACKSLEFQSGHMLPVSPQSLVASVLQLSHSDSRRGLSVVAFFNSASDFGNEAARSVDIPIEVAGDKSISNLSSLLTRFGLKKYPSTPRELFVRHLMDGFRRSAELEGKKSLNLFIDDFERDDQESFKTCLRLLPVVGEAFNKASEIEQIVLMRALTILFFNRTPKRNSSAISKFAHELLSAFRLEEDHLLLWAANQMAETPSDAIQAIDEAIIRHRFRFEISNPLSV